MQEIELVEEALFRDVYDGWYPYDSGTFISSASK